MPDRNMDDKSPEEVRARFEWFNSPEYREQLRAQLEQEEVLRRSVTAEEAAAQHMQEIVIDGHGTVRFRENVLVTAMLKRLGESRRGLRGESWMHGQLEDLLDEEKGNALVRWLHAFGPADMNDLAQDHDFSREDWEQFAMLIGYSLSGAEELSYFSDAMWGRANAEAKRLLKEKKESLEQWAEREAPSLDADGWTEARVLVTDLWVVPPPRFTLEEATALLTHRDKVAAELTASQVRDLQHICSLDPSDNLEVSEVAGTELLAKRLVRQEHVEHYVAVTFGRQVASRLRE